MKTRLRSCSLLLCLAVVMAASPGFAATPGADARRDRVAQMIKEGWQQVAPGVLQRNQDHKNETFTLGSEGFSWLAGELKVRHGLLLNEYKIRPVPALKKEIEALAQQISKVRIAPRDWRRPRSLSCRSATPSIRPRPAPIP